MTEEQFLRWQDFAVRMAEHCYPKATEARREKILEETKNYFCFQEDWPEIEDWDGNGDNYFLGDQVKEFFEKYLHYNRKESYYAGKFYNQVTCCIRAGFDIAVEQSGGVVGFTAGDVRRMWSGKNEEVPSWVKEGWEIPFDGILDEEGIWL